jgi:hypothetical protein
MSHVKRYTNWADYWVGLRTNLFKCVGTAGTAWLGTVGLSASGIPGTQGMALDWRQVLGMFGVHIGLEIFTYMKNKQPEVVTEEVETTISTKPIA